MIGLITVCGGLGGVVFSIYENGRTFKLPSYNDEGSILLGSLSDILIGSTASLGVFFLLAGTIKTAGEDGLLRVIGLGVVSGLGGTALLPNLRNTILNHINEFEKDLNNVKNATAESEVKSLLSIGMSYLTGDEKQLTTAEEIFKSILEKNNDYLPAYAYLSDVYKQKALIEDKNNKKLDFFSKALDLLSKPIANEKQNTKKSGYYLSRASVYYAMNSQDEKVKKDLEEAKKLNANITRHILEMDGHGFKKFRNEEWFKKIINNENEE